MKSLFGATALLALAAICDAATVLRPREAASCTGKLKLDIGRQGITQK